MLRYFSFGKHTALSCAQVKCHILKRNFRCTTLLYTNNDSPTAAKLLTKEREQLTQDSQTAVRLPDAPYKYREQKTAPYQEVVDENEKEGNGALTTDPAHGTETVVNLSSANAVTDTEAGQMESKFETPSQPSSPPVDYDYHLGEKPDRPRAESKNSANRKAEVPRTASTEQYTSSLVAGGKSSAGSKGQVGYFSTFGQVSSNVTSHARVHYFGAKTAAKDNFELQSKINSDNMTKGAGSSGTVAVGDPKPQDPSTSDEKDEADDLETCKQVLEEVQHGRPYTQYPKEYDPNGPKILHSETLAAANLGLDTPEQRRETERKYCEVLRHQRMHDKAVEKIEHPSTAKSVNDKQVSPSQDQQHAAAGSPVAESYPMTDEEQLLKEKNEEEVASMQQKERFEIEAFGCEACLSCEETHTCEDEEPDTVVRGFNNRYEQSHFSYAQVHGKAVQRYDEQGQPVLTERKLTAVDIAEPSDGSDLFTAAETAKHRQQKPYESS